MNIQSSSSHELLSRLDRIPVWPYQYKLLVIIGAGFFFSFFDIVTIAFALPEITRQFSVSADHASWAISSGLIGYIIGSLLDSRIADRYGRKISLYISVSVFSLGSLLSATSPTFEWLVFWRLISGMGIGAEIALVTTYMAEISPAPLRGRFTGWAITAGFLGFAAVPLIALQLVPTWNWGWRALFVAGALGGIIILFMRRNLPPSPRWLITHGQLARAEAVIEDAERMAEKRLGHKLPSISCVVSAPSKPTEESESLLLPLYRNRLILLACTWFLYYVGNYAWLTLAPELLEKAGFKLHQDYLSLSVTGFGFVAGSITAVFLSDQIERKIIAALIALLWSLSLCLIGWFPSVKMVMIAGFIASYTIGLIIPVLYTYTGENFPTRSRATAIALSDGFGHLGGAFCGQIIFAIYSVYGFVGAFFGMALTGLLTAFFLLFGPSTNNRSLDKI